MQMIIYNSAKSRLETVNIEITENNSTWFDDCTGAESVCRITDIAGGLLIMQDRYEYPTWIDGVSRADINHDPRRAHELLQEQVMY